MELPVTHLFMVLLATALSGSAILAADVTGGQPSSESPSVTSPQAPGEETPPTDAPSSPEPESEAWRQARDLDRRLTAELEAIDPDTAEIFRQAIAARERGDHAEGSRLYGEVYSRVPAFVHALRRQCHEELALGHREMAVALCRNAVRQKESADNLAALTIALISGTENFPSRPPDRQEAFRAATRAVELEPDNIFAASALCQVALDRNEGTLLRQCVRLLEEHYPDDGATHLYQMFLAVQEGRDEEALRHLERARASGLVGEEGYRQGLDLIRRSRWSFSRLATIVLIAAGIWLGLMGGLLLAGLVLSRLALRAAETVPAAVDGVVTGMDTRLRRIYQVVLWLCCGYYYVSIPIVVLLVLAVGAGTIYAFFWLGQIPIKLVIVIGLVTAYTLVAVARSLFVRGVDEDPGERLDLDRHSRLRDLLNEVAGRVGTRPVDNVYMTPGAQVAVMERGRSLLSRARGRAERCLILGAAALEGMHLGPFRAVLAHEYGHFSNRDTAGGGFALVVRRSTLAMAEGIAGRGVATWYNPAWLFVNGFHRVFLRVSQGASRLQEVLADRWAALTYGSKAFEDGLRHVISRSVRFDSHASVTLNEVIQQKRPLENLYSYQPEHPPIERGVDESVREALEANPSPYDSHPSPADRIAWVRALASPGASASSGDGAEVWSLFQDREAIERTMTAVVRRNVAAMHGVQIPGPG